jgi:hypothetical protein
MSRTTHVRLVARLLDGGHPWGSLCVSGSRCGVHRIQLVVFPPGMSREDRILLRLARGFPLWGTVAYFVLEVVLVPTLGSGPALVIAATSCLGAGGVAVALAGSHRLAVRTLTVVRMSGVHDDDVEESLAELRALATTLADADARFAAGELGAVDVEAVHWHVYDRMPARR